MKKIFYVRSTSIINDSRATKEITSLINNGYDVTVVGWDRDSRIKNYSDVCISGNKVKCIYFKKKSKYGSLFSSTIGLIYFQIWLNCILKKYNKDFDVIHACDFDCGYMSYKVSKKFNKKLIYDMYDYYVDSRPMPFCISKIIKRKEDEIINNCDAAIICGEWRKKQIIDTKPKLLEVIHNSPNIDYIEDSVILRSKNQKLKVCYVGILQENRLLLEILDYFKCNNEYELHIGGFGKYEKEFLEASKYYKNIFFYGSLKYNEVLSLEKGCDVLFATYNPTINNHKYSAPNKVYEAMALGKPIIVCKNTGIDELVKKNQLGFLINYNSHSFGEILTKIKSFNSNNSRRLYEERYSWKIMEKKLINLYKKVN